MLTRAMIFRIGKKVYLHGVKLQQKKTGVAGENEVSKSEVKDGSTGSVLREVGYKLDRMRKLFVNELEYEQSKTIIADLKLLQDKLLGSYTKSKTDAVEAKESELWRQTFENVMLMVQNAACIEFTEHRKGVLDCCKSLLELEEIISTANDEGSPNPCLCARVADLMSIGRT